MHRTTPRLHHALGLAAVGLSLLGGALAGHVQRSNAARASAEVIETASVPEIPGLHGVAIPPLAAGRRASHHRPAPSARAGGRGRARANAHARPGHERADSAPAAASGATRRPVESQRPRRRQSSPAVEERDSAPAPVITPAPTAAPVGRRPQPVDDGEDTSEDAGEETAE